MENKAFQHIVIRASAGTGKTFRLSNRYLGLAATQCAPSSILATTFTRKAAGEILDRVFFRLAVATLDEGEKAKLVNFLSAEARGAANGAAPGHAWLQADGAERLLRRLLHDMHRLRISTLDSFFSQVARSFSLELELPPGWQIIEGMDDARLRLETVQRLLEDQSTADVVRLMHLLGKGEVSRSVTDQLLQLADSLLTVYHESSEAAWTALPNVRPLPPEERDAAIERLEHLALPQHKTFVKGVQKNIANARAGNWADFLKSGLAKCLLQGAESYCTKPITAEMEDAFRPLLDHAKAELINPIAAQNEATFRLLERFRAHYDAAKIAGRVLCFEDVTRAILARGLLDRPVDVAYRLDGDVEHLLLDEFQDTAPVQWRVLRPFARHVTRAGSNGSFFCVGDVKQAIYGWRGGVAEIFDTVERELDGLESMPLDCSYRSSQAVIETVNRVFSEIDANSAIDGHRDAATAWAKRFHEHATHRTELPGFCQLLVAPVPISTYPNGNGETNVAEGNGAAAASNQRARQRKMETLEFAADHIAALRAALPDRSIGVLVRKNETVARLIYLLKRRDIEASEEGGNPLVDSSAVHLMLSLLTLADHPGDTVARYHIATSCLGTAAGLTDHEMAADASRLSYRLRHAMAQRGYGPVVRHWAARLSASCDAREATRLEQLVDLAYSYDTRVTARVDDFIEFVRCQRVESPTAAKVRVMTIHQSKGLQFDVVVLPELDERLTGQPKKFAVGRPHPTGEIERVCRYVAADLRPLLPVAFQRMFDEQQRQVVEESLCVLYVALTRAVHGLMMIIAPSDGPPTATSAGVLRSALADGLPATAGAVLYEHGDSDWLTRLASKDERKKAKDAAESPPDETFNPDDVRLAVSSATARGLDRQSPSQLEGGPRVDLAERLRLDRGDALDRGTALHAMFQTVYWLDDGPPSEEQLREAIRGVARPGADRDELLAAFRRAISHPVVAAALTRATYLQPCDPETRSPIHAVGWSNPRLEVTNERAFIIARDGVLLRGTIDRLTILRDGNRVVGADVIDYKTDRVSPDDAEALAARVELYRPQLAAYREAVCRLYALAPGRVSARLLFVHSGALRCV